MKDNKDVLQILLESNHLTEFSVEAIARYAKKWEISSYRAVIETHLLTEPALADVLAEKLELNRVYSVSTLPVSKEALKNIGFRRAKEYECIPIGPSEDRQGKYEVVVADPTTSAEIISELEKEVGSEIVVAVGERSDILCVIDRIFPVSLQLPELYGE